MLLFLPGLICDARVFAPQLAAFPGSRAVDGYGMADSLADMARKALAFADREGAERFDLFGHSMGGRVALELFRLAPQRVRRLALSNTGVHSLGASEPEKRHALRAIGHERGYEALVDTWLPPMVAEANRARPELYGPMRQMSLDAGQAVFDAQIAALLGPARRDCRGDPRYQSGHRDGRGAHAASRSARSGELRHRGLARPAGERLNPTSHPAFRRGKAHE